MYVLGLLLSLQQWECVRDHSGKLRLMKCRAREHNEIPRKQRVCNCSDPDDDPPLMNRGEKRLQRHFIRTHVSQRMYLKILCLIWNCLVVLIFFSQKSSSITNLQKVFQSYQMSDNKRQDLWVNSTPILSAVRAAPMNDKHDEKVGWGRRSLYYIADDANYVSAVR